MQYDGAKSSADLHCLIEALKANGLIPLNYVMHLLSKLPKQPDDLEPFMPWSVRLKRRLRNNGYISFFKVLLIYLFKISIYILGMV